MATKAESDNPYAPPTDESKAAKRRKKKRIEREGEGSDRAKDAIMESFRKTRPWVAFFSVLGYVATGVLVLGCIGMLAGETFNRGPLAAYAPIVVFIYLGIALFSAFVANRLGAYKNSINEVLQSDCDMDKVAHAVERQQQYWSLVGTGSVGMMIFYALVILFIVASR